MKPESKIPIRRLRPQLFDVRVVDKNVLFQNNLVSVLVSKCLTDTDERVMLSSQLLDVVSGIWDVS